MGTLDNCIFVAVIDNGGLYIEVVMCSFQI